MKKILFSIAFLFISIAVFSAPRPIKVIRWGTYSGKTNGIPNCPSSSNPCVIVYANKLDGAAFLLSDVYFEDPDTHLLIQVKNLGEINYGGGNYGITYETGAWEGPFNWTPGSYGIEYLD